MTYLLITGFKFALISFAAFALRQMYYAAVRPFMERPLNWVEQRSRALAQALQAA